MNTIAKIVNGFLVVIGMLAVGCILGLVWGAAEAREAGYWAKLNQHVLKYGDVENHDCPYSAEWCNPHYQKHLKESRAKKPAK